MTTDDSLPFITRLWFAWLCFFRVLFDPAFASRAWKARALPSAPAPAPAPAPALAPAPPNAALRLLALFQREGRLVDFLEQDIASFSDADVGAAARVVHEGCRKALRAHITIEPVRPEAEGSRITLPQGFDAGEVKLIGDVRGDPPYTGALRHRGWRAAKLELPAMLGNQEVPILAPAEVELG